jgi:phage-related minor tail protein
MLTAINSMTAATQAAQGLFGAQTAASAPLTGGSGAAPTPFSDLLTDAVGQVNQLEGQASPD